MGSQVAFGAHPRVSLLQQEAHQDADAVNLLGRVIGLLQGVEQLDALSAVFHDAVEHGERPLHQQRLAANFLHNVQEDSHQVQRRLLVLAVVEELALLVVAHLEELLDDDCRRLVQSAHR